LPPDLLLGSRPNIVLRPLDFGPKFKIYIYIYIYIFIHHNYGSTKGKIITAKGLKREQYTANLTKKANVHRECKIPGTAFDLKGIYVK